MPNRRTLSALAAAIAVLGAVAVVARAAWSSSAAASHSLSSRNLVAPASLSATPSGHNTVLSWPAGTGGNGYAVDGVANGSSSNCSAASFASLASTTATSYTDTGRYQPQGTRFCYRVSTTYGTWSSQSANPTAAAQLGVVAASVKITNGATAGRIDAGDTIAVTFNQAISTASGPPTSDNVCTNTSGRIVVGSTGSGTTCSTTQADLGVLSGLTVSRASRFNATWTWSGGNTVLTVTVGALTAGGTTNVSGTGTFTPNTVATSLLSATGSFHTCDTNTGGGLCLPTATGAF